MEKSIIGYLACNIPRVTSPGSAVGNKRGEREGEGMDGITSHHASLVGVFSSMYSFFFLLRLREG